MSITELITSGAANPVYLFLVAMLIGGLHGLEPGHSKTLMAAYIIAIRGTVFQALLLGVAAAVSHSVIVWIIALVGLTFADDLIGEKLEPYFIIGSGVIVLLIAAWMAFQIRRDILHNRAHEATHAHHHHDHEHGHPHAHEHHQGSAHARAHTRDIEQQLARGGTSNWQTILFGLSGGLIPCPAAITVLILCLQVGSLGLGVAMVSAFSIGLAITLVTVGVIAALGVKFASQRMKSLDGILQRLPYLSALLILAIGCVMIWFGWAELQHLRAGENHG